MVSFLMYSSILIAQDIHRIAMVWDAFDFIKIKHIMILSKCAQEDSPILCT